MLQLFFLTAALVPQGGTSTAPVVINEFSYDDSSTDDLQFVELYNRTYSDVDISNWTVVGEEGSSTGTPNGLEIIPPNTVLPAGGFYVIGDPGVPNVDQVLVSFGLFENGPDGLTLRDTNDVVIDAVTWEMSKWTAPIPVWLEGDGLGGDSYNAESNYQSVARSWDGWDDDDNGSDFRVMPWSPGTSNQQAVMTALPYANMFDDTPGSTVAADFNYSFVTGTTVDPASLGIAPSPQGGNCSTWYDPTGGGSASFLQIKSHTNLELECYVYFAGPNAAFDADDGEAWTLGVRGGNDSFADPYDVGSYYAVAACGSGYQPGATGIAWSLFRTQGGADLYLLDYNNGGGDFTVLGGPIAIQSGVNDGWQRLRLLVRDDTLTANFGGTYGVNDGTVFTASSVYEASSSVYLHYRECVSNNADLGPLTLDQLQVHCISGVTIAGAGSPTSVGVPVIGTAGGSPLVGNTTFAITGSGLPTTDLAVVVFGFEPLRLPGTQIPGAQPGALLFVDVIVSNFFFTTAQGTLTFPLPIPANPALVCSGFATQLAAFDWFMAHSIPIGTSQGMLLRIGT